MTMTYHIDLTIIIWLFVAYKFYKLLLRAVTTFERKVNHDSSLDKNESDN
ncbi:hypothetical protein AMBR_MGDJBKAP_01814 [Leuconostoc pseudomesenteroides]|jgi:hypothetical protein|nr:hypothetical protein AMBR_MGDJBKAP_01814 [Leuconostoc pseudomesenteroides]